jgi:N-acetylglucosamine-6-phosphate deacetylase
MDTLVVRNGNVVGPAGILDHADLVVRKGRIVAVGAGAGRTEKAARELDAGGMFVWPGLIDMHIHGARGELIGTGKEGDVLSIGFALMTKGITRFCPTIPPMPREALLKEVSRVASACVDSPEGALPLGLHIEGPFLNPERSGVLPSDSLRDPDTGEFEALFEASGSRLKMMTIAPELPNSKGVIECGAGKGVVMSAGHTEASFTEMEEAVGAGLRHVTHCFNAMRRVSHRSPGPIEATLTMDALTADVICDGSHVHQSLIDILLRCKSPAGIALVSDATAFQAPDGSLAFLDRHLEVRRGLVRDTQTGALGGSAISLWDAVVNLHEWFGRPFHELANLASRNPARILGLEMELGSLEPGKRADFFIADEDFGIHEVFRDGVRIWREGGPSAETAR